LAQVLLGAATVALGNAPFSVVLHWATAMAFIAALSAMAVFAAASPSAGIAPLHEMCIRDRSASVTRRVKLIPAPCGSANRPPCDFRRIAFVPRTRASRTSRPVSYTHLDVYKRQVLGIVEGPDARAGWGGNADRRDAVAHRNAVRPGKRSEIRIERAVLLHDDHDVANLVNRVFALGAHGRSAQRQHEREEETAIPQRQSSLRETPSSPLRLARHRFRAKR